MQWGNAVGDNVGTKLMVDVAPIVYVVDDDISVREALEALIRESGWEPKVFEAARDFLREPPVTSRCPLERVPMRPTGEVLRHWARRASATDHGDRSRIRGRHVET